MKFRGTVYLKDWLRYQDGRSYLAIHGECEVMRDTALLGFAVRGSDSNWAVQISGGENVMTVLGCQIRCIETVGQDPIKLTLSDTLVIK